MLADTFTFTQCVGLANSLLAAQSRDDRRTEAKLFVWLADAFNYDSSLGTYAATRQ
jgi:hypothetical protein